MKTGAKPPYELEAAGLEEFLRLLEIRLREPGVSEQSLPRRAVCVADMFDQSSTEIGIARVRRYIRAAFVYGDDLVSLQLVSSNGYEHPDPQEVRKLEDKQSRLLDRVREGIAATIDDQGLSTWCPIVKAFIHPAGDSRVGAPQ